jgi:signal transduction histidine kinase
MHNIRASVGDTDTESSSQRPLNPQLLGAASRRPWAIQSFARQLWYNRPVSDEKSFVLDFRNHSFSSAYVATCAAALVASANAAYRQFVLPGPHEPLLQVVLISLVTYWIPPIIFTAFKEWSVRYYHWVLGVLYAFYFYRLGVRLVSGTSNLDDSNLSFVLLIVFYVIFLRIPFRHALILSGVATVAIDWLALREFGGLAFRLLITSSTTAALALYTSWRMEGRDRGLFAKRLEAAAQAQEAQAQSAKAAHAAAKEQEQRKAAESAAVEADKQRVRAAHAVAEEQEQRIRAEGAAGLVSRLHDELSALYAQRELLIRGLHHDANQSLYTMGSDLRVLQEKASIDPALASVRPALAALVASTRELDGLMSGMYDLVKLGKYEPRYEPVATNDLLRTIATRFASLASEQGLKKFIVKQRKDNIFLWTDTTAIERMLGNLVCNAIKYTPKDGGVLVGTVRHGNTLRIDVWDTGVGIPRDKKDEIFKEFVRLGQPGVGHVKGLGLGLAIVKLFRDKLVGHYLEHSSKERRGSRFSISIPIVEAPPIPVETSHPTLASVGMDIKRTYVAVIEDNQSVQACIGAALRAAGYAVDENVRFAASVAEIKNMFDNMPDRAPNVVVCDFRLGDDENANDVIRLVDERFNWARVPIIVFSAEIQPKIEVERPYLRVVVKTGNPAVLVNEMEMAIVEARRDCTAEEDA